MDKIVVKTGKIFQIGKYPDKKFDMDLPKLKKVISRFSAPVPLDLNHKPTVKRLDSKLGKLTKVWHDDAGQMFGRVEIPEWLNETVCKDDSGKDLPLPVSCAFVKDDEGFMLTKLALTDNPRVSDAAIFAAFSEAHPDEAAEFKEEFISAQGGELATEDKFSSELISELVEFAKKNAKTNEGQSVLQQVHDTLARAGAVCRTEVQLHSATELNAIQKAHDEVVASGASCKFLKDGEKPLMWFSSEMSDQPADSKSKGDNMDSEKLSLVQSILKFIDGGNSAAASAEKEVEAPKKVFSAEAVVKDSGDISRANTAESTFASPEVAALKEELEAEKKKTAKLIADGISAQSKIIANEIIAGKHAQEKERAGLELAFSLALTDDQSNPVEVQFSADAKGGRVDALKALYMAKTIVPLTEETVDEKETEVLLSDDKSATEETAKKRLEAVRERAKALAAKKNHAIARK